MNNMRAQRPEALADINALSAEMQSSWADEGRVQALKLAIQLAKRLGDGPAMSGASVDADSTMANQQAQQVPSADSAAESQPRAYARLYGAVSCALDKFGSLVTERIRTKATVKHAGGDKPIDAVSTGLDTGDQQQHQLELAKQTCRNWLLKIGSIRELTPRFYLELATLDACEPCITLTNQRSKFAINQSLIYAETLQRLIKTALGFGDPMVAMHARCYLSKVARRVLPSNQLHFELQLSNLEEAAKLMVRLDWARWAHVGQRQAYLDVMSGALQSLLAGFAADYEASRDGFSQISGFPNGNTDDHNKASAETSNRCSALLECLLSHLTQPGSNMQVLSQITILHSVLRAMPAELVGADLGKLARALKLAHKAWKKQLSTPALSTSNQQQPSDIDTACLYGLYACLESFALALDACERLDSLPSEQQSDCRPAKVLVLADRLADSLLERELAGASLGAPASSTYLSCFKAWLAFAANHGTDCGTLDKLISKFVLRIRPQRAYVKHQPLLLDLIKSLMVNRRHARQFRQLFGLKSFGQLFQLLSSDQYRLEASKWILESTRLKLRLATGKHQQPQQDVDGELNVADKSLANFMLLVFGAINDCLSLLTDHHDLEHLSQLVGYFVERARPGELGAELEFMARCRAALSNLAPVLEQLTLRALALTPRNRQAPDSEANACLAFAFVTAPASGPPEVHFDLLIAGCRLAFTESSVSLADCYLKQALANLTNRYLKLEQISELSTVAASSGSPLGPASDVEVAKQAPLAYANNDTNLAQQVESLIDLVLQFQHVVDMKHKMALIQLVREPRRNVQSPNGLWLAKLKCLNTIGGDLGA